MIVLWEWTDLEAMLQELKYPRLIYNVYVYIILILIVFFIQFSPTFMLQVLTTFIIHKMCCNINVIPHKESL